MKNLLIAATVLATVWVANAQVQPNETRPENGQTNYIVDQSSGTTTLTATDSIWLKPGVHLQSGGDFHAYLTNSPYEPPIVGGGSGTGGENYIYTRSYQKGMADAGNITSNHDVIEGITYFDGLGRPLQQIAIKASPDLMDIVTHIGYDGYGRMAKEYLPYEAIDPLQDLGSLRPDALAKTNTYYTNNYPTDLDMNAPNPFSEKEFEPSPLNRVLKQAAPGEDWKLGNGHEIGFEYLTNTSTEVLKFEVTFNNGDTGGPILSGGTTHYLANELYKNITKDENWQSGQTHANDHTVEEFTDKRGRVVLKRTYNENDPHDTYYVYDAYDNLTYVIPPKVDTTDGVSAAELDGLCYQYRYDHRNRLIEKKIPGKGSVTNWESIVYNTLDQPIMTQDPNLKAQDKWLFTKYDAFGRVAYTGTINSTADRAMHQSNADTYGNDPNNTQWAVAGTQNIDGMNTGYNNGGYPNSGYDELFTISFYDGYDTGRDGIALPTGPIFGQTVTNTVQGMPTVGKVKVLDPATGTDKWITTLTAYDKKGRAIYNETKNDYLTVTDIIETELDFAGKALRTKSVHIKGNNAPIVVNETFEYDHMARLKGQEQNIAGQKEQLFANTYDGIGQLVKKEVGHTKAAPLQEVDYGYNIRGWLKKIGNNNTLFTMGIRYNTLPRSEMQQAFTPLYNGNISEISWASETNVSGINLGRNYVYSYDPLNRIAKAESFAFLNKGSGYLYDSDQYTVDNISYDKNGNLKTLDRKGGGSGADWDKLIYTYDSGNQLLLVIDAATGNEKTEGFNDFNTTSVDYAYDQHGNMTQDLNKGITGITYNHLNLPEQVTVSGTNVGTISYIYDATGVKLRKNVLKNGVTTPTDYAGNYIYENNQLQFFNHAEGTVSPKDINDYSQGFDYVYDYVDHLGNVRLSYTDANGDGDIATDEIVAENNYYPFGLAHKGYNNNVSPHGNSKAKDWKFGDEEFEEDLGKNTVAYQWRDYDPAIGRFNKIDRFAEKYVDASPYSYITNNPIHFREVKGDSILVYFNDKDGKRLNSVPKAVQKMFKDEFGISVGYNSDTNMLYLDGEVDSELSQSESATGLLVDALTDTNTGKNADKHGTIKFGYNLKGIKTGGDVSGGDWTTTGGIYRKGVTQIDLADFDSSGKSNLFNYSKGLNPRSFGLARTFEHEYLGHQRLGVGGMGDGSDYNMGRVVQSANQFNRERGIPERLNYYASGVIFFGSTSDYKNRGAQRRAVRQMVQGSLSNELFVKRKK